MGLACSQIRLLTLTARKADCEYGISIDSMQKMALTREQTQLSQEYYSKLQSKQISYYANGQYNKINYTYLMGSPRFATITGGTTPLKDENSMILTDYKGQVVLDDGYADAITSVLGSSIMNSKGQGGTFSVDKIAEIMAALPAFPFTAEQIQTVIDGDTVETSGKADTTNTLTGEATGEQSTIDTSDATTSQIQSLIDFYYPIFSAAAANGWTTEYNKEMETNDDYLSDAIVNGTFQLASVGSEGTYEPGTSLTYFTTAGLVQERTDSDVREEITAWYNAEKERISEKENYLDIDMDNLSTELESINTEIQSIQSLIDDAISSVFDWGSS